MSRLLITYVFRVWFVPGESTPRALSDATALPDGFTVISASVENYVRNDEQDAYGDLVVVGYYPD
jgi:hypothetical protein